MSNTNFSNLTIYDKKMLCLYLKDYLISYRDKLNFDSNITFGLEIEMNDIDVIENRNNLINLNLEEEYFSKEDTTLLNGSEIVSPILRDNKLTWINLKKILDVCKVKGTIDKRVGSHIHIGSQIMKDNYNIINLIKLWSTYENIIYRFSAGEYYNIRDIKYCKPCKSLFTLINNYNDAGLVNIGYILNLLKKERYQGLNFQNYESPLMMLSYNTLEVRTPNGTLEETIWQNNINFFIKLLLYATRIDFNEEILNNRNDLNKNSIIKGNYYINLDYDGALELADLIFDNDLDKLNFLKEYFKDFNINKELDLIKVKRFIK